MIEGRARQRRASAISELLHRPVLKGGLFIVEEKGAVLDCWAAVRAPSRIDEDVRVLGCRNVGPPM